MQSPHASCSQLTMAPNKPPFFASQPFKAFYFTYFILTTPPYILYLAVKNLLKPFRRQPAQGFVANVVGSLFRAAFRLQAKTRSNDLLAESPRLAKGRIVKADAAPADLFTGALTSNPAVKPAPVEAIWFPSAPGGQDDIKKQRLVMHFPGGAFVIRLGHEGMGRKVANVMMDKMKADKVIWAQYRVARGSDSAFPASLQDAISFYAYVLSLGYDPKNIFLSGDSAGGNAVIAVLRYLEETKVLPLPAGAFSFSPWVHLSPHAGREFDQSRLAAADILDDEFLQWGSDMYRPAAPVSEEIEAYVSPLHRPFKTSVPLFLHACDAEAFGPLIKEFGKEMIELNGPSVVRYHGTPNASHDLILCYDIINMEVQMDAVMQDARDLFQQ